MYNSDLKGKLFPLADMDYPYLTERQALGLIPGSSVKLYVRAKATGEFREPKAGEWYLSGAIVEAYRAPYDLTNSQYYIAKLVRVKMVEVREEEL